MKVYAVRVSGGSYEDSWESVTSIHASKEGAMNRVDAAVKEAVEAEFVNEPCVFSEWNYNDAAVYRFCDTYDGEMYTVMEYELED